MSLNYRWLLPFAMANTVFAWMNAAAHRPACAAFNATAGALCFFTFCLARSYDEE